MFVLEFARRQKFERACIDHEAVKQHREMIYQCSVLQMSTLTEGMSDVITC